MHRFQNILYACTGRGDETQGLQQALSLARHHRAALRVFLIHSPLPKGLEAYRESFHAFISRQIDAAVQGARATLNLGEAEVPVTVDLESSDTPPAIGVVRQVLVRGHDLVIKEAEPQEGGRGFNSTDMTLLRKCPCPVWLARPIRRAQNEIRVAVAVSPESRDENESYLSIKLLRIGRSLADTFSGELDVISCSDHSFEEFLRRNTRVEIPEESILSAALKLQSRHDAELRRLIEDSGIDGPYRIRYLKGHPETVIPNFVETHAVDILVMGTVARSGIVGFLIGNTAENVMGRLGCTLPALKPDAYVSPLAELPLKP